MNIDADTIFAVAAVLFGLAAVVEQLRKWRSGDGTASTRQVGAGERHEPPSKLC